MLQLIYACKVVGAQRRERVPGQGGRDVGTPSQNSVTCYRHQEHSILGWETLACFNGITTSVGGFIFPNI